MAEYVVHAGYLCENVGVHTCGAGADGYGHEPGCGLEPIATVEGILKDLTKLRQVGELVDMWVASGIGAVSTQFVRQQIHRILDA